MKMLKDEQQAWTIKKEQQQQNSCLLSVGRVRLTSTQFLLTQHPWIEHQGCDNKGNDSILEYLLLLKILCHEMCKEQNGK